MQEILNLVCWNGLQDEDDFVSQVVIQVKGHLSTKEEFIFLRIKISVYLGRHNSNKIQVTSKFCFVTSRF